LRTNEPEPGREYARRRIRLRRSSRIRACRHPLGRVLRRRGPGRSPRSRTQPRQPPRTPRTRATSNPIVRARQRGRERQMTATRTKLQR
jgi:hypothetical protein